MFFWIRNLWSGRPRYVRKLKYLLKNSSVFCNEGYDLTTYEQPMSECSGKLCVELTPVKIASVLIDLDGKFSIVPAFHQMDTLKLHLHIWAVPLRCVSFLYNILAACFSGNPGPSFATTWAKKVSSSLIKRYADPGQEILVRKNQDIHNQTFQRCRNQQRQLL